MRRLLAVASTVAMLAIFAVPASAASPCGSSGQGAQTCTMNLHDQSMTFPSVGMPCLPDGTVSITNENGVIHFTVNRAGDFWATGTFEGNFTAVPFNPLAPTFTGHFAMWFGDEQNNKNFVSNSTFNIQGKGSDGSTIDLHASVGFGVSASGNPIMHMNLTC